MLAEKQQTLLELVQEGEVFVSPRLTEGRRIFVAGIYATDEDKKFTKVWLKDPHFGLNS